MKPKIITIGTVEQIGELKVFSGWELDPRGSTEGYSMEELEKIAESKPK